MLSLETIEREIDELEHREASYRVCERLAWLYTVRDHIMPKAGYETTDYLKGSEFLELSSGVNYRELMEVLNEHMQTLSLLQPKIYEAVMGKIRALRR